MQNHRTQVNKDCFLRFDLFLLVVLYGNMSVNRCTGSSGFYSYPEEAYTQNKKVFLLYWLSKAHRRG